MNRVHYDVSGLLNAQVKTQLKNVLSEVDGVNKINVDMARSSIEVGYNDLISEDRIKESIEHVGCKIV